MLYRASSCGKDICNENYRMNNVDIVPGLLSKATREMIERCVYIPI